MKKFCSSIIIAASLITCLFTKSMAQDSSKYTFLLSREDIQTANLQNLEQALSILPLFHSFSKDGLNQISYGSLTIDNIAVYKDGFPAALDQNINYDYRSIPLWDIDRIEIHLTPVIGLAKNSGIIINLYSIKIPKSPIWSRLNITNTSLSDFHGSFIIGLSNVVHSGQVGLSRSFTNNLYDDKRLRSTSLGAFERYDLNLKYQYKILPSVTLNIQSDHSKIHTQNKGNIISGTSRVRDHENDFNKHNIYGSLQLKASKNHTLSLEGMAHHFKSNNSLIDKNLNTGQEDAFASFYTHPNIGYNQGHIKLSLKSHSKPLGYSMGINLSNTRDNTYPYIDAISTAYNDYSAYGILSFRYRNTILLNGGINLWHNNLSGNFLLPQFQIKLAPREVIQLNFTSHASVSYAPFSQLFYPPHFNNGVRNNVLLEPLRQNAIHANIILNQNNLNATSGMLFITQSNIPRVTESKAYVSSGKSSSFSTYASIAFSNKILTIKPSAMMHSNNNSRDTGNFTFFYPELNLNTHVNIPGSKFLLGLTAKYIGKRSSSFISDGIVYIAEQQKMRFLSIRIQRNFIKEKLQISFGINNILQSSFIDNNTYQLTEIDRNFINNESIISGYPRSFTFKVIYTTP